MADSKRPTTTKPTAPTPAAAAACKCVDVETLGRILRKAGGFEGPAGTIFGPMAKGVGYLFVSTYDGREVKLPELDLLALLAKLAENFDA